MRRIKHNEAWGSGQPVAGGRLATAAVAAVLLAGVGAPCRAQTVSATVGFVRRAVPAGQTLPVCMAFETGLDVLGADGVAVQLAGNGESGDRLHVWLGDHFNSYVLSGGRWHLFDSLTVIPGARLDGAPGAGYMLTRYPAGETTILLHGGVSTAAPVEVEVGAGSWRLLGCPHPQDITLGALHEAGAANGDRVKVWDASGQVWRDYAKVSGAWFGSGGDDTVIPAATAFLYFNSGEMARILSFHIR